MTGQAIRALRADDGRAHTRAQPRFRPWRRRLGAGFVCTLGAAIALLLDPAGLVPFGPALDGPSGVRLVPPARAQDTAEPAPEVVPVPGVSSEGVTLEPAAETLGARAYASLLENREAGNVVVSPVSLELALGIIGEATADAHKAAIAEAIGLPYETLRTIDAAATSEKATLSLANALWLANGNELTEDYSKRFRSAYGGEVFSVDFSGPGIGDEINAWVARKTDDAIKRIIDRVSSRTSMVLTNAFYFKGDWLRPFDPQDTEEGDFDSDAGQTVRVPMMERSGIFPYARTPHGQVVRLFYTDTQVSLTLYLAAADADPAAARADALAWLFRTDHTGTTRPADGTLAVPRLTLETGTELTRLLAALGLGELFGDSRAIQEITGPIPPSVTDVVQRTYLELTEEGTTAAAATAVVGLRSAATERFTFIADRPFHLALHHAEIPTPLIVGYVGDPS